MSTCPGCTPHAVRLPSMWRFKCSPHISVGFLLPPKMARCEQLLPYNGLPIHPRQWVFLPPVWYFWDKRYPMTDWCPIHPIQGVSLPCTQCSQDRLCSHCDPNQNKAITEKQVSSQKVPWSNIYFSAILPQSPFLHHVGLVCGVHWLLILECQEESEKQYFIWSIWSLKGCFSDHLQV